jgi:hypothetical protein
MWPSITGRVNEIGLDVGPMRGTYDRISLRAALIKPEIMPNRPGTRAMATKSV